MPSCVFRWCKNYTASVRNKKNVSFHTLPKYGPMKDTWLNVIRNQRSEDDWMPTIYSTVCSEHFLSSDFITTQKNNMRRLKKNAVPVIKIENDTDNFVQFKLVGGTLRIKPNINPHKFDCQKPYEECNRMERGQLLNKETHENTYIKKSPSDDELGGDKDESVSEPITISNPGAATNTHSVYIKRSPSDDEMEEDNNESKSTKKISITEPVDDGNLSDSDLSCSDVDEALESIKVSMMRKELKKRLELLKKTQNKVRALHKRNQRLSKKVASLKTIVNTYKEGKCCCHAKINDDSDSDSK
ncbi:uncharacterized protein LOC123693464 isoform X3 [Colias croceus]|uniref:uncharacterized protein LOC123693464 isoform X3 n=1 Tax=Colias crocea TaxID=72248 RepID=UPI001E27BEA5|nr:uncharacterized protein LOC123693464 isoform X3 [Colias croceus]